MCIHNISQSSLFRAHDYFSKALSLNRINYYAASGLACVMAELGHLKESKDIFTSLHRSGFSNTQIMYNLGHNFVEIQQYPSALKTVTHIFNDFSTKS